jgi:electron transfer flavoprotein alpha subunit
MGRGIWVYAEEKGRRLPDSSLEVIGEGRRLADQQPGEGVSAIILGAHAKELTAAAVHHGADRVFVGEGERFARYDPEAFASIMAGLIRRYEPAVFLLAATEVGKDLGPRVAAKARAGFLPGCDRLQWSAEGLLVQTRLSHGRKVHTTALWRNVALRIATVEPGIGKIRAGSMRRGGSLAEIVPIDAEEYTAIDRERIKVKGFIPADPGTVDITDARIIVAGGKGAIEGENFRLIRNLADALGASVAGSRAAVDHGCLARERQIGQSGKTVSPDLLISCGISGANAHVMGMRDSEVVVAINIDRNAPILKLADLAVVGDLREILPALTDRLRNGRRVEKRRGDGENLPGDTPG